MEIRDIARSVAAGEEVPEVEHERLRTWLLMQIFEEITHLCGNVQQLLQAQGIEPIGAAEDDGDAGVR